MLPAKDLLMLYNDILLVVRPGFKVEQRLNNVYLFLESFDRDKRMGASTIVLAGRFCITFFDCRFNGELIGWPCSGVRPFSFRRQQFQRSSPLKPLGQSKPNFTLGILRKVEESLYKSSRAHDQDGCHRYEYENRLQIFFSRTRRHIILKLGVKH